jgi:hypothetical protein
MTEKNKRPLGKEEIPLEKRVMEVLLTIAVIASMTYFFMLIVVL